MTLQQIGLVYAVLTAIVGIHILVLTLFNTAWLFHTTFIKPKSSSELVSVLIPARNEAESLPRCLDSLLAQTYRHLEIIVYDDDSTDETGAIIDEYARKNPGKISALHGKRLEAGWYGKPHALQRMSEKARGHWLLCIDADTVHSPESVSTAVALAHHYKADLVSGYTRQALRTFGEAETVPALYLLTMLIMPLWLSHTTSLPSLSHAIGQYMFFRAKTYRSAGGYESVKNQITEDVRIAREIKRAGGRVVFADLKTICTCRMYGNYQAAITGLSKNVFDYMDKRKSLLLLATIAVPLFMFIPILGSFWLPAEVAVLSPYFRVHTLCVVYAWAIISLDRRLPWYVPLIYPLILINTLSMGWRAAALFRKGQSLLWKGRMVT